MAEASKTLKRSSTRTTVLSKAMRIVDEETRKQVRDARLMSLEADNYNEEQDAVQEEEYLDEEADGPAKKSRKTKQKQKPKSQYRWSNRKPRFLEQVIYEMGYENQDAPNYVTVNAAPSTKPARQFCSVCGYFGVYACTRCGMRYCSQKCQDHHRETRCLKFAL